MLIWGLEYVCIFLEGAPVCKMVFWGMFKECKDQWINGEPDSRNEITETGDHREIRRTVLETNLVASDTEASCSNCKENTATNMDLG